MDQRAAETYILGRLRDGLPPHRSYHSQEHTLDVYRTAITIAAAEGVSGEDLDLLKTAALFHDTGFLVRDDEHEQGSCMIAREALPDFGYTTAQIDRICEMIMATKIPQAPVDELSRILCDADLDYLGRPDFFRIGATLFNEFKHYGVLTTEREWNELQVRFLEKHHYFTRRSKLVREPVKRQHLAAVIEKLDDGGGERFKAR
jgi:predicted metal-dependent HD superfamily phosphohydrolase